jgi:hypothetical protein
MAARRSINKIDVIAGDVRDAAARDVFPLIRFGKPHAPAIPNRPRDRWSED